MHWYNFQWLGCNFQRFCCNFNFQWFCCKPTSKTRSCSERDRRPRALDRGPRKLLVLLDRVDELQVEDEAQVRY